MSHKTLVRIAIVMVIVFGLITALYPRIFSPHSPTPIEAVPAAPAVSP